VWAQAWARVHALGGEGLGGQQPHWRAPLEAGRERSVEAAVLGLLFLCGASAVMISLAFPQAPQVERGTIAWLGALGYPAGGGALAWGRRMPHWVVQVLLAGGSALTAAGVYFAHGAAVGASAALFYVWVAMFAFHFLSLRTAVAQLAFAGASYAVVVGVVGGRGVVPQWVLTMTTAAVAGAVMAIVSRRLRQMAVTDELTGLPNRQFLAPLLELETARARREGSGLCLAMVDVDGFKAVNDRLGHGAGDEFLVAEVRAWRRQLRGSDTLVRYGGDEFIVVMPGADLDAARAVLARLSRSGPLPASAGIAALGTGDCPEDLIARADRALYETKHARPQVDEPSNGTLEAVEEVRPHEPHRAGRARSGGDPTLPPDQGRRGVTRPGTSSRRRLRDSSTG
jgi:diguanylate cyclase (GGDEF)-like protein